MKPITPTICLSALLACGGNNPAGPTPTAAPPQAQLELTVITRNNGLTSGGFPGHSISVTVRESGGVSANFNFVQFNGTPSRVMQLNPTNIQGRAGSYTVPARSQLSFSWAFYCNSVTRVTADLTDANGHHHSLTWTP
jgi:hypothetical protein